jgi:trans-2,3-dihydro-3-hydroxyanthranilate isomerase
MTPCMARRFHTLDVFTGTRLAGNPLAVVHDSAGLDTAAMQAITREFNLSETVFVLPPEDPVNTAKIRIFTPGAELPFAGHPTVGTAVLLATLRAPEMLGGTGVVIALEEAIGLVKVEVTRRQGKAARGVFDIPRLPGRIDAAVHDTALTARALGLNPDDIGLEGHEIGGFAAGVPYVMVPMRDIAALGRARSMATAEYRQAFAGTPYNACPYLYARTDAGRWRTRMFAPLSGIPEDPATGSAAAAFAGVIMAFERPSDGTHQHVIAQGVEMGRPSEIVLTLEVEGGELASASIGGEAVIVSEGTLHL